MNEQEFLNQARQQRQEALIMIQQTRQQRWQAILMAERARQDVRETLIMVKKVQSAFERMQLSIKIDSAIWI